MYSFIALLILYCVGTGNTMIYKTDMVPDPKKGDSPPPPPQKSKQTSGQHTHFCYGFKYREGNKWLPVAPRIKTKILNMAPTILFNHL